MNLVRVAFLNQTKGFTKWVLCKIQQETVCILVRLVACNNCKLVSFYYFYVNKYIYIIAPN